MSRGAEITAIFLDDGKHKIDTKSAKLVASADVLVWATQRSALLAQCII